MIAPNPIGASGVLKSLPLTTRFRFDILGDGTVRFEGLEEFDELTNWLRLQTDVLQGSGTQQQLFQRMQGSGVDLLSFFSY